MWKDGLILKSKSAAISNAPLPQYLAVRRRFGIPLFVAVIALSVFGLVMLYSASYYTAEYKYDDAFYYVKKQAVAFAIAVAVMIGLSRVPLKWVRKCQIPLLVVSFVLMGLVFIPALGVESYGARRWLNMGFFSMQPSEIAKFAFVLSVACYADRYGLDTFRKILPPLGIGAAFCVLLLLEPNMSVTMIMLGLVLLTLYAGGAKGKYFALLAVPIVVAVPVLVAIEPYRLQRLLAFVDPWASPKGEGYQLIQSYYALGSGGWFGVGFLHSRQKYMFLPFAESDFIFSVIGEEWGLVGAVAVMALILFVVYSGYRIASASSNRFAALLAYGITSVIALQSLLNVAVVTGCVPPTGVPLPFVSFGGSSLVCFASGVGVLLSIDRINAAAHIIH